MMCWSRRLALSICWGHLSFALCASLGHTRFWRCLVKSTNWIGFKPFWLLKVYRSAKFQQIRVWNRQINLSHIWDHVTIVALSNSCIYTKWASDFWSIGLAGLKRVIALCHTDLFLAVLSSRSGLLFVGNSPEWGMDLLVIKPSPLSQCLPSSKR